MKQNVFFEAGFGDEDATVMALETDVAIAIARYIRLNFPNNQTAAAKRLKVGQNEISALLAGNLNRFSLAKLIRIARRAGIRMFLDTGDNAIGARAATHDPTLAPSPASFGIAESIPLVEDYSLGTSTEAATKVASSKARGH